MITLCNSLENFQLDVISCSICDGILSVLATNLLRFNILVIIEHVLADYLTRNQLLDVFRNILLFNRGMSTKGHALYIFSLNHFYSIDGTRDKVLILC